MKTRNTVFSLCFLIALLLNNSIAREIQTLGEPISNIEQQPSEWNFFTLQISSISANVTDLLVFSISLSSGELSGIYADVNKPPSQESYKWKADANNILTIDPQFSSQDVTLYLGIQAMVPSVYSLNTYLTTSTRITLNEGETQLVTVKRNSILYLDYYLGFLANITITASPVFGDPDLYVSIDERRPSPKSYTWQSREYGADFVSITNHDPNYRYGVYYHIGVSAYTDTTCIVTAAADTSFYKLLQGVPMVGKIARQKYTYFFFQVLSEGVTVTISTSNGDLFVNYNTDYPKPSITNYQWASQQFGANTVTIQNAKAGTYYIALYGYTTSDYALTASIQLESSTLVANTPVSGVATSSSSAFYKFFNGDTENHSDVVLTPLSGDPVSVFLSSKVQRPSAENFEIQGIKVGEEIIAALPNNPINWYIGVYTLGSQSSFSIQAKTDVTHVWLRDSEASMFNHVSAGYYKYFVLDNGAPFTSDVAINVNAWRGSVDLYASANNPTPTKFKYQWKPSSSPGSLYISARDPALVGVTRLYVGVIGLEDSYFSIMAMLSNSTMVTKGSTSSQVGLGRYKHFAYTSDQAGSIKISTQTLDQLPAQVSLYVSNTFPLPNEFDYTYKSTQFGPQQSLAIDNVQQGAKLFIGVKGASGASGASVRFVLDITTTSQGNTKKIVFAK